MLRALPIPDAPELIVGAGTGDDAAVWRLDAERALIVTVDVITPVVDDPRSWGRVAATNAVSDVYAMGGTPLLALNIVHWNNDELPLSMLEEAMPVSATWPAADHFVLAGGHTITDPEPKLGLAVVGLAHPDRLLTNAGLRAGQALVLTKPLGVGVITTGIKRGVAPDIAAEAAIASMTRSNRSAASVALGAGATGATDITGFGLLGHLGRMAVESHADVTISRRRCLCCRESMTWPPASCSRVARIAIWPRSSTGSTPKGSSEIDVLVLADPQTSGGLCFGVDAERAAAVVDRAADLGAFGAGDRDGRAGHRPVDRAAVTRRPSRF